MAEQETRILTLSTIRSAARATAHVNSRAPGSWSACSECAAHHYRVLSRRCSEAKIVRPRRGGAAIGRICGGVARRGGARRIDVRLCAVDPKLLVGRAEAMCFMRPLGDCRQRAVDLVLVVR